MYAVAVNSVLVMKSGGRRRLAVFPHCLLALALLLEASAQQVSAEGNQSCQYVYEKRPPVDKWGLNCDPFGAGVEVDKGLVLLCEVSGPLDSDFEIAWFKNDEQVCSDSLVEVVECSQSNQSLNGTRVCSQLTQLGEQVQQGNKYFCQVLVNGSLTHTVPSTMLEILDSSEYMNFGFECLLDPKSSAGGECADMTSESPSEAPVSLCSDLLPTPSPTPTPTPSSSLAPVVSSPPPTTSPVVGIFPSQPASASSTATPGPGDGSEGGGGGESGTLQLWLYVVVAVAAVFAMIIIILAIMCMGLCLRKSQTGDSETLKQQERQNGHPFTSTGIPSLWNGDQPHPGNFTDSTHLSSAQSTRVPEFSAYSSLGERDYEVIDIRDDKNEYHRLQRPHNTSNSSKTRQGSLPSGRHGSTTSTQPLLVDSGRVGGTGRVNRGLDNPHYDVSAEGEAPPLPPHNGSRSAFSPELLDGSAQPLPNGRPTRKASSGSARMAIGMSMPSTTLVYDDPHEALYSPAVADDPGQFHHALQTVPETGTFFPEPSNPLSFPVHVYDYVPSAIPAYETPVPSKPTATPPMDANCMGTSHGIAGRHRVTAVAMDNHPSNSTDTLQSSLSSETDYPDVTSSADCTGTGEAVVNFPLIATPLSSVERSPRNHSVGQSTTGDSQDHRFSDAGTSVGEHSSTFDDDFTTMPLGHFPNGRIGVVSEVATTRSLPDFSDTTEFVVRPPRSSTVGPAPLLNEPDTNTDSSDFTGPIFLPHLFGGSPLIHGGTPPPSNARVHHYKTLDPLTMDPVLKYTKIHMGTVV